MTRVTLEQGSLTDGHELVLINASNTNAQLGSGVSGAIRHACGPKFQGHVLEALKAKYGGPMAPGQLLMTDAGAHPRAKFVAHLAVMDYRNGFGSQSMPTLETIRTCCENLWSELERLQPPAGQPLTVAMVALGAGTGNLGVIEPTRITAETLTEHLRLVRTSRIAQVTFYGYLPHEYAAMAKVLLGYFPEVVTGLSAEVKGFIEREGGSRL
jgi:O-acetyl-ADP-ribose deacetylase (regulator of RNase III)